LRVVGLRVVGLNVGTAVGLRVVALNVGIDVGAVGLQVVGLRVVGLDVGAFVGTTTVMLVVKVAPVAFKELTLENNGSVKVPLFAAIFRFGE
jgi:hypothetical protein